MYAASKADGEGKYIIAPDAFIVVRVSEIKVIKGRY